MSACYTSNLKDDDIAIFLRDLPQALLRSLCPCKCFGHFEQCVILHKLMPGIDCGLSAAEVMACG